MKKISLLAFTYAAISSSVQAQEVAVVPAAPCSPQPCPCPQAFKGFYAGGSFGYGIGGVRTAVQDLQALRGTEKYKLTSQGFDGGLLVGYTYVFSNKIGLGLDAYFNWASTQGQYSLQGAPHNFSKTISLKNAFQLRVPVSYVICNLVAPKVYVGWDNSQWVTSVNFPTQFSGLNKSRYNGFLWGVGVDFLLAKHIISGLEYTGVISQNKTFKDPRSQDRTSFQTRPVYNTFKATLKFIY